MSKQPFQVIGDVQVWILDNGKFEATLDGRTITRADFASVKREINKDATPVRAIAMGRWGDSITETRIRRVIEVDSDGRYRIEGDRSLHDDQLYVWDAAALERIIQIEHDLKQLLHERYELQQKLVQMNKRRFVEARQALKQERPAEE